MREGKFNLCFCGSDLELKNCCSRNKNCELISTKLKQHLSTKFYGYDTKAETIDDQLSLKGLVCVAILIKKENMTNLVEGAENRVGEWVITGNAHEKKFKGPFKTIEETFKYGFRNFNVVRWSADWELS
jgi:hypothetical protein